MVNRSCWMVAVATLFGMLPAAAVGESAGIEGPFLVDVEGAPHVAIVTGLDLDRVQRTAVLKLVRGIQYNGGAAVEVTDSIPSGWPPGHIILGTMADNDELVRVAKEHNLPVEQLEPNGFLLWTIRDGKKPCLVIAGADSAGVLYGAQEALSQVIRSAPEYKVLAYPVRRVCNPAFTDRIAVVSTDHADTFGYDRPAWEAEIDALSNMGINILVLEWQGIAPPHLSEADAAGLVAFAHDRGMPCYMGIEAPHGGDSGWDKFATRMQQVHAVAGEVDGFAPEFGSDMAAFSAAARQIAARFPAERMLYLCKGPRGADTANQTPQPSAGTRVIWKDAVLRWPELMTVDAMVAGVCHSSSGTSQIALLFEPMRAVDAQKPIDRFGAYPAEQIPFVLTEVLVRSLLWQPNIDEASRTRRLYRRFFSADVPEEVANQLEWLRTFAVRYESLRVRGERSGETAAALEAGHRRLRALADRLQTTYDDATPRTRFTIDLIVQFANEVDAALAPKETAPTSDHE